MNITFGALYFIIAILTILFLFFKRRFSYWKNRGVPYIEPTIPHGNLKDVGKSKHFVEAMDEIYYACKKKSPFAGSYFSISPVAVITDLDLIKTVLIRDFHFFRDRSNYCNEEDDPLSGTLFFVQGERWTTLRKKLSPAFTSGKMKFMYPTLLNVCDRLVAHLSEVIQVENDIEVKDVLGRYTTDVIGECAFGIECNSLRNPKAEFRKFGAKVFNAPKYSKLVKEFLGQCPEIGRFFRMKLFSDDVIEFFLGTITETIEFREKNNVHRNDFIDLLIQMKNDKNPDAPHLTMLEIVAQVFGFFLAAFETSSSAMSFSLYELAVNPDLQEKARQEVNEVLDKHNGEMTYDTIMDMNYVGLVMTESIRKYPVLMAVTRKAVEDYKVPGTDKIIEKGTGVVIPIYSIHHDPEIYPNPDVFDPERFRQEEVGRRHPMAFLGFGDGPRNCIGMRFGVMQSRLGLAKLLKNFRVKLSPKMSVPLKLDPNALVLSSLGGLYLVLEKI